MVLRRRRADFLRLISDVVNAAVAIFDRVAEIVKTPEAAGSIWPFLGKPGNIGPWEQKPRRGTKVAQEVISQEDKNGGGMLHLAVSPNFAGRISD